MVKRATILLLLLLCLFWMFIFSQQSKKVLLNENPKIYTSFYPLYFAVDQIAGNRMLVETVVPDGAEVHSFEPSAKSFVNLEKADIFFYIGLGMEPWADRVAHNLQEMDVRTVEISKELILIELSGEGPSTGQKDGHNHYNSYNNYDPHVWLDPLKMKEIGRIIKEEIIKLDPQNKNYYQSNYQEFAQRLDNLHKEFEENLEVRKRDFILVSHAAFGYLGNRYNFHQLAVTGISPQGEPSPGTIARLIKRVKEEGIKYIFRETLANPRTVQVLVDEVGLEVLILNPIAGLTTEEQENNEDYFTLMKKNLENLKKGLGE